METILYGDLDPFEEENILNISYVIEEIYGR